MYPMTLGTIAREMFSAHSSYHMHIEDTKHAHPKSGQMLNTDAFYKSFESLLQSVFLFVALLMR